MKNPFLQRRYIIQDWKQYIRHTGVDERRNQPVRNKTIGRHLHQGGSSLRTAPLVAVIAQMTGTQPYKPPPRSRLSNLSPRASPSNSLMESLKGATSSPPTALAGQKKLIPCPTSDRDATVNSRQFTNLSRNRRASRRKSVFEEWLPTVFRVVITRVLA